MDDMITLPDSGAPLLDAIRSLVNKIEDLDVSIDYLAAAVTGQSAMEVGGEQSMLGRMASPVSNNLAPLSESQLKQMIEEQLEDLVNEQSYVQQGNKAQTVMRRPEGATYSGAADSRLSPIQQQTAAEGEAWNTFNMPGQPGKDFPKSMRMDPNVQRGVARQQMRDRPEGLGRREFETASEYRGKNTAAAEGHGAEERTFSKQSSLGRHRFEDEAPHAGPFKKPTGPTYQEISTVDTPGHQAAEIATHQGGGDWGAYTALRPGMASHPSKSKYAGMFPKAARGAMDKTALTKLDDPLSYARTAATGHGPNVVTDSDTRSHIGRRYKEETRAGMQESQLKQMIEEEYAVLLEDEAPGLTAQAAENMSDVATDPNLVAGSFDLDQFKGLTPATSLGGEVGAWATDIKDTATLGGALGIGGGIAGLGAGGANINVLGGAPAGTHAYAALDFAKIMPENKLNKIIEEELQRLLYESKQGQI